MSADLKAYYKALGQALGDTVGGVPRTLGKELAAAFDGNLVGLPDQIVGLMGGKQPQPATTAYNALFEDEGLQWNMRDVGEGAAGAIAVALTLAASRRFLPQLGADIAIEGVGKSAQRVGASFMQNLQESRPRGKTQTRKTIEDQVLRYKKAFARLGGHGSFGMGLGVGDKNTGLW